MKLSLLAKTGIEGSQADVPVSMDIRPLIYEIRGQHVILDRDLALLYGVPTKALNQAVKRNTERFPDRFMFRLSESEMGELVTNCDRFGRMKHSSAAMCAFTEQGIAMLSSVLRSAIAVRVSIRIMDAFVATRKALASMVPMQSRLEAIERRQISDQSRNEERFDQMVRCVPQRRRTPDFRRRKVGRGDDSRPACLNSQRDIRDEQLQERRSQMTWLAYYGDTNEREDGESAADSYPGVRNTELGPNRRGKFDIITAIPIAGTA